MVVAVERLRVVVMMATESATTAPAVEIRSMEVAATVTEAVARACRADTVMAVVTVAAKKQTQAPDVATWAARHD